MNEIYIVLGSYGKWDSHRKLNHGAFTSLEKAEEAKKKIEDFHKNVLSTCPVKLDPEDKYHMFRHYDNKEERQEVIDIYREWLVKDYVNELSIDFTDIEIQPFAVDVVSIKEYPYTEELYRG